MSTKSLSIAPMMKVGTKARRELWRIISPSSLIYLPMLTAKAIINNQKIQKEISLENDDNSAFQIADSSPLDLYQATLKLTQISNFKEINLNAGCPSQSVANGNFGLAMLRDLPLLSECLAAITEGMPKNDISSKKPEVSLKTRIGIDELFGIDFLSKIIDAAIKVNIKKIILHARLGVLSGISPKKNLVIPKLDYAIVRDVIKAYPNIVFVLNGGITSVEQAGKLHQSFDNIMIGRLARDNPCLLGIIDKNMQANNFSKDNENFLDGYYESKIIEEARTKMLNHIDKVAILEGPDAIKPYLSPYASFFKHSQNSKAHRFAIHSVYDNNLTWQQYKIYYSQSLSNPQLVDINN